LPLRVHALSDLKRPIGCFFFSHFNKFASVYARKLMQFTTVLLHDNLKWQTNTDYIIGKAVKRLFLLKILKKYGADKIHMKRFYISAIRPTLEYGAQVWHGAPHY
jgi:hypothetical protein